jgi:hypothetical protein
MCGRLYSCETLLEGLAQHLQDMSAELRQFIQKEDPMVRQRHLTWPRHLAAPDQPHIGDGVMRGAKRARSDDGGTGAGEASDAMDAGGFEGLHQGLRQHLLRRTALTGPVPFMKPLPRYFCMPWSALGQVARESMATHGHSCLEFLPHHL